MRFTEFYAAANTCSPSRAALMTGRYPPRSGVNAVLFHDTPEGLPASELTIPELLRDAGYRTAMVGKWHLGNTDEFMPLNHGFDEFYGVAHSNNDEANFFVYDGHRRIPETVDQSQTHPPLHGSRARLPQSGGGETTTRSSCTSPTTRRMFPSIPPRNSPVDSRHGTYGGVVKELDASVGEVLAKIADLGISAKRCVILTSDNGPWLAMRDWGGSAGPLRGGKTSTFEGGQRVPALVRWPQHIPAASEAHGIADMMDWLPTLVELAGAQLPADRPIDGRSLVGVLQGTGERDAKPFFYLRLRFPFADQHHQVSAVRDGRWKLKLPQRGYPPLLEPLAKTELYWHGLLLFDLEADPGEQHDVAAEHPDVVERLTKEIEAFDASLSPARPVLISAAPYDHTGWEKMWRGVAAAAAVVCGSAALLLLAGVLLSRRLRRR